MIKLANSPTQPRSRPIGRLRRGSTATEFVVAFALLSTLIAVALPTVVRNGRMQEVLRHDRIGMDELTNQLDRLTQLPLDMLRTELEDLRPSEFANSALPRPKLSGTLGDSEDGQRLSLGISWDDPGRNANPLMITTWIYSSEAGNQGEL
jgi:hypothetical protein